MTDKVCIIGAGASGLASAKVLHERSIPFDCFEMGSDIGGVWRYENDNGRSAAYRSLHINTTKSHMQFSDFPFPDDVPQYPHHTQILTYFQNYVAHFGFRDKITFNTCVEHVKPLADGGYAVTLSGGEVRHYRAVMIANGHHWCPRYPDPAFEGDFNGETLHSNFYRVPEPYIGKNVVILGIGNSGVDIAVDVSRVAKNTYLSTRSGAYIVPKYMLGRPLDHWGGPLISRLPIQIQSGFMQILRFLTMGNQESYGIPTPDSPLHSQHMTVSSELPQYVAHGKVTIKPNIKAFDGDYVIFEDGSREAVDAVIYATGYQIKFPFLDTDIMNPDGNDVSLYHLVAHPEQDGLYVIGLCQPLGAIMPLSEQQAIWVADLIEGKGALPDSATMYREIEQRKQAIYQRYDRRPRHTIQVDFHPYLRDLKRARQESQQRATNQVNR